MVYHPFGEHAGPWTAKGRHVRAADVKIGAIVGHAQRCAVDPVHGVKLCGVDRLVEIVGRGLPGVRIIVVGAIGRQLPGGKRVGFLIVDVVQGYDVVARGEIVAGVGPQLDRAEVDNSVGRVVDKAPFPPGAADGVNDGFHHQVVNAGARAGAARYRLGYVSCVHRSRDVAVIERIGLDSVGKGNIGCLGIGQGCLKGPGEAVAGVLHVKAHEAKPDNTADLGLGRFRLRPGCGDDPVEGGGADNDHDHENGHGY